VSGGLRKRSSPLFCFPFVAPYFPESSIMKSTALLFTLAGIVGVAPLAAACSSSSGNPTPVIVGDNGVNDVSKACVIRSGWTQVDSSACARCTGYASEPRCPCADIDYDGACASQQTAVTNIAGCTDARNCAGACMLTDCNCVANCYAGKDQCKTAAGGLDGCLAEICGDSCK
jgi:hypothetical protein